MATQHAQVIYSS